MTYREPEDSTKTHDGFSVNEIIERHPELSLCEAKFMASAPNTGWHVGALTSRGWIVYDAEDGEHLAWVIDTGAHESGDTLPEMRAHLFSASKDLLNAANKAYDFLEMLCKDKNSENNVILIELAKAINKAQHVPLIKESGNDDIPF